MTLHLTPEILVQAYELLRATPPFKRWKLPHADEVEFRVAKLSEPHSAEYTFSNTVAHRITVCPVENDTLAELLCAMAHEMTHMRQYAGRPGPSHGPTFKRLAAQVCRVHGFDEATF
jgi:hypothetical protein